ncbi:MAG TPA: YncE family protein [Terracidiphilus sp.]|nr:YncE family protein [Terracidiphilus sp.]
MSLLPISFRRTCVRLGPAGTVVVAAILISGCGDAYRPVVTPIGPSGPAQQPEALAVAVSSPSPTSPGVATIIDYAGDTVMAQADIGPGPLEFAVDQGGSTGYTLNGDGTLTNFDVSTSLRTDPIHVRYSTLPTTAEPYGLFAPSAGLWAADLTGNVADVLTGSPETFKLAIPVASTPIAIIGPGSLGQDNYAISQNIPYGSICNTNPSSVTTNGEADALETASYSVSAKIALGACPVYAVSSSDGRRVFVLNRGSDTVTVINSQNDDLDSCTPFTNQNGQLVTCHPSLPLSTTAVGATGITPPNGTAGMPVHAGPVYAEYNAATAQLVVADYDGGTISVIDVSLDEYGNDSATFGTTYTIPVGNTSTPYPASVTVLFDGSRAYTANQGDDDGTGNGTVSIVNLSSHSVEKTLAVVGHPRTVVSTSNSLYGKVYVDSPDSPYLTIIRTDQDIVDTTILLEGNVVDVRTSNQNGSSGNAVNTSRRPGAGQPCYLPPTLEPAPTGSQTALQVCQTLP